MRRLFVFATLLALCACAATPSRTEPALRHPISYVEIPVTDMERAMRFYAHVFALSLRRETVDGYDMALFDFHDNAPGATGALAKGDVYVPSHTGSIVYFIVDDIDAALARAQSLGARILYPKKDIGENGFVAEIEDSEGNRIALSQY